MSNPLVATYLIGLREGLEATLVVSILVAFLVRSDRRGRLPLVWAGAAAAVALSVLFGWLLTYTQTSLLAKYEHRELFEAITSVLAVVFVTWMIFWMRRAARSIGRELRTGLDEAIAVGPLAVVTFAFLAVVREGLETTLIFFTAVQGAQSDTGPLLALVAGILTSIVLGFLLYVSAVRINLTRFFTWTGALLVLVAAGILKYGVHDFQEAGVLPGGNNTAFDLTGVLDPNSWYGALLEGMFNLTGDPSWLEVFVWLAYAVPVLLVFLWPARRRPHRLPHPPEVGGISMRAYRLLALAAAGLIGAGVAGCGADTPKDPAAAGPIAVTASDTACDVAAKQAPAGTVTFKVTNKGSKVTEFYVFAAGDRVMGEVENIAPGLARELHVELAAGTYETACKPGMVGKGIRSQFAVSGSAQALTADAKLAAATESYQRYVRSQTAALLEKAQEFVDAVKAGDVAKAKALFPISRTYWERIEPVAEIFGDLDPKIDGREEVIEEGMEFTGFHRIEKDLWVTGDISKSGPMADRLMTDIKEIVAKANAEKLSPLNLANGAKELLDEVATGKITGEEDRYSHTDLWDFAANLEGSQAAISALRPVLEERAADLVSTLDTTFAAAKSTLEKHRRGDGWRLHNELSPTELKELSDTINALAEPVSKVAAVVAR